MATTPTSKTGKRKLTAKERERIALDMRIKGKTFKEIAEVLGITEAGAFKAAQRAIQKLDEKLKEKAEQVLTLEIERLNRMIDVLWPQVEAGEYAAVDRILRVMERRAKYLGLDKPAGLAISGEITHKHELTQEERLKRLQFLLEQRKNGHLGTGTEIEQLASGSISGD